jgi:23S rRNA-/tRNA-specific pseudouridylate synthase
VDQGPSHYTIEEALAGQRLDRALALLMPDLSRTRLKALMLEGAVSLNGQPATNPKHKTATGDAISIQLPPPVAAEPLAEAIPLSVVFEDEHLLVLDKPAGLVVHPASGHDTGTLVNALLAQDPRLKLSVSHKLSPLLRFQACTTPLDKAEINKVLLPLTPRSPLAARVHTLWPRSALTQPI